MRFAVLSSIVLGLVSLLIGLSIFSSTLLQESVSIIRTTAARAALVAEKSEDTAGLSRDVMEVYGSLTPEQRSKTGTEEYRQLFRSLSSVSGDGATGTVLTYKLRNYVVDVSALYVCALDTEQNAIVILADTAEENPRCPGDWEAIPAEWTEQLVNDTNSNWEGTDTLYFIRSTKETGPVSRTRI